VQQKAYYREDVMGSGSCVTVVKSTGRFMQVGGLALGDEIVQGT